MTIKEVSEKYHISQDTLRYYERMQMIPRVHRTSGGIRDYQAEDLRWVELALCMRGAGLPVEVMIEYLRLFQEGDATIPARLELLNEQMDALRAQKAQLEELFGRSLNDVRILTPFECDFGNRVKFGKGVFINHSAILSASGGIEFEDGVMAAPGLHIATINHDMNHRHTIYTYGKVTVKKNAWLGMNVTLCPGVTIGRYAVVGAGAVVTKDVPDYAVVGGVPARLIRMQDPAEQAE